MFALQHWNYFSDNAHAQEMAERARLEKEILEISEREQRRIGHDLHPAGLLTASRPVEVLQVAQMMHLDVFLLPRDTDLLYDLSGYGVGSKRTGRVLAR